MCRDIRNTEPVHIGSYRGFEMNLRYNPFENSVELGLKGSLTHFVDLGKDTFGNIKRINNALEGLPGRLSSAEMKLDNIYGEIENAEAELKKSFPQEAELAEKTARSAILDAELNMDNSVSEPPEAETPEKKKPSITSALEKKQAVPAIAMRHREASSIENSI
jgi:hypothetical protein